MEIETIYFSSFFCKILQSTISATILLERDLITFSSSNRVSHLKALFELACVYLYPACPPLDRAHLSVVWNPRFVVQLFSFTMASLEQANKNQFSNFLHSFTYKVGLLILQHILFYNKKNYITTNIYIHKYSKL
jgi:hypothetical protein